ncbi:hypothetical protein Bhyg_11814 [Pseudolycoriella hygida]|uniref:Uncharacterized protein n=1 Tax=Pseudolycoriella hygida TaxID=35572 RepID=A0A9Q0RYQ3_9DIPT|nr:hypothetical protein Bhyg_11814 [Pseudolycoriella hygida]
MAPKCVVRNCSPLKGATFHRSNLFKAFRTIRFSNQTRGRNLLKLNAYPKTVLYELDHFGNELEVEDMEVDLWRAKRTTLDSAL